ncbi:MAG: PfkB family carbohydrate kinase [Candidatus Goldiibacteriota bacterium]
MSVVIVGSMAFDTIHTPHETRERVLGGSCVYGSMAASFFGKSCIIGVVGDDFSDENLKILEEKGIETKGVEKTAGKSFFWEGKYHEDMNTRDTITTELNVFEKFDPKIPQDYADIPYLFLANIEPSLQMKVLRAMKKTEFVLVDTMNLWINIKREELTEVFEKTDCIVLNDEEIRLYTGKTNLIKGAREILKIGPKYVIIKKGEYGVSIIDGGGLHFSLPSYPVEDVVDPTGAGDTFAGAFIGHLAKEGTVNDNVLKRALACGNAAASFTVEGFSIEKLQTLSAEMIEERIETVRKMCEF